MLSLEVSQTTRKRILIAACAAIVLTGALAIMRFQVYVNQRSCRLYIVLGSSLYVAAAIESPDPSMPLGVHTRYNLAKPTISCVPFGNLFRDSLGGDISIPLLPVGIVLAGSLFVIALVGKPGGGRCQGCGYNLEGLPEHMMRCPECSCEIDTKGKIASGLSLRDKTTRI